MSREEELLRTKKFVRDLIILRAKAENRLPEDILKEMKLDLEKRKLERQKSQHYQSNVKNC